MFILQSDMTGAVFITLVLPDCCAAVAQHFGDSWATVW